MTSAEQNDRAWMFRWQHGPAPGLTFYQGREIGHGPDVEIAMRRAKAMVCRRGGFLPGCITMKVDRDE